MKQLLYQISKKNKAILRTILKTNATLQCPVFRRPKNGPISYEKQEKTSFWAQSIDDTRVQSRVKREDLGDMYKEIDDSGGFKRDIKFVLSIVTGYPVRDKPYSKKNYKKKKYF